MLEKSAKDYEYIRNFPYCVASIDGKHVLIECPKLSGSRYFNYKGFFSVILQGLSVDVGACGRQSDSDVFSQSNLFQHLESGFFPFPHPKQISGTTTKLPYVILGDQGYPLKDYLMRPYSTDNAAVCRETEVYNYWHSRARRTVECAFGILVSKWRCLKTELQVSPEHVDKLVSAACFLHNLVIDKEDIDAATLQTIKSSDTQKLEEQLSEDQDATIERREKLTTFVYDSKFILAKKGSLISNTGVVDFQYNQIDTYVE